MCGICGIINKDLVQKEILEKMTNVLYHRGPDGSGIYLSKDSFIGLGHRRLKIIDLSDKAAQPMSNEDETIWIVYNGEFYNFKDYYQLLKEKGHLFKSKSDSEVVLHLYEEFGLEFIQKLRGMYALAVWDSRIERLILAVDPVGIKPLYYFKKHGIFAFSSEIKSLLEIPEISREVDLEALNFYFALGYIPREYSIFKEIKKVLPGHIIIYEKGVVRIQNYSNPSRLILEFDECELVEQLFELLLNSINLAMISDVPVGIFLSGGLDSSIMAAIAASTSNKPIKTFSIGFETNEYNELPYARKISQFISSDHHEFIVTINALDVLSKIAIQYDEPFADSSAIPTYYVSKMASDYVNVALSGDGGDELFGGYNWYSWVIKAQFVKKVLGFFSNPIANFSDYIPFNIKGKSFLSIMKLDPLAQFINRVFFFSNEERSRLLDRDIINNTNFNLPEKEISKFFYSINGSLVERMQNVDFNFYLPYDGLVKVDRASMLSSLEVRPPYLDHDIIKFAFSLPENLRIKRGIKKYLLKKLGEKILPKNFPLERKHGFCIPLREWMKGRLGDMLEDLLIDVRLKRFINVSYAKKLLNYHRLDKQNNGSKLWSILMFSLWIENYMS